MCPTFLLFKNLENKLLTACTSLARMLAYQAAVVKLELKMQQMVISFIIIAEELIGYYMYIKWKLLQYCLDWIYTVFPSIKSWWYRLVSIFLRQALPDSWHSIKSTTRQRHRHVVRLHVPALFIVTTSFTIYY